MGSSEPAPDARAASARITARPYFTAKNARISVAVSSSRADGSGAVLGVGDVAEHPLAARRAGLANAGVLSLELVLSSTQGVQDLGGDVVPALFASAVAARQDEQRAGVFHDDTANVRRLQELRPGAPFFDVHVELSQLRHDRAERGGGFFTATPLSHPFCDLTSATVHWAS